MSKDNINTQPGHTRLGRGLSSLMAKPVKVEMPAEDDTKITTNAKHDDKKVDPSSTDDNRVGKKALGAGDKSNKLEDVPRGTSEDVEKDENDIPNLQYINIDKLRENPYQPRKKIDANTLKWLSESIKSEGVMQPIVVRPYENGEGYELIAGERRWRAAKLAGVKHIPATVRDLSNKQAAEWALVENVQREDLNPLDRAEAFSLLAKQFNMSHKQIGEKVGLERTSVANFFKLLELCEEVRDYVRSNRISSSKGRIIARLSDLEIQKSIARLAIKQELTVKQLESKVNTAISSTVGKKTSDSSKNNKSSGREEYLKDLEQQLALQLNTRVHIKSGRKKGSGALTVEFYSLDQFDALMNKLGVTME